MNTDHAPHGSPANPEPTGRWANVPWAPFVIPFLAYGLIGSFEPAAPVPVIKAADAADAPLAEPAAAPAEPNWLGFTVPYEQYPFVYTLKIAATIVALVFFWPAYTRSPYLWGTNAASPVVGGRSFQITPLAMTVGIVGGVLWIALASIPLGKLLAPVGLGEWFSPSDRPAFNPLEQLKANPAWAYGFLAIRFVGLVLVVAMMEELFLRGFLMRFVMHANWPQVPFGEVNPIAIAVGTIFPILSHPFNEMLAVIVWFSLVTWLMVRTKNFWDCVAAHAITNLLLGIYVVTREAWWLW